MDESTAQVWKLSAMDMGDADINPLDEYVFKNHTVPFFSRETEIG